MSNATSVVEALLTAIPQLRPRLYFKTSLTALSHAMEDHVLAGVEPSLVIASFQQQRFYLQEANRYLRIAELTDQVYVLSAQGTSFADRSDNYSTITFDNQDALSNEWHLIVMGVDYSACLVCRERAPITTTDGSPLDQNRRFEGVWTQDRYVSQLAATILLDRITDYRPELSEKVALAKQQYIDPDVEPSSKLGGSGGPDPFTQRLVTYLQAGQYKLLKAYKAISSQEQRERLVNSITAVIRQSMEATEIFELAAKELGQALGVCRCLIYPCGVNDMSVTILHQHLKPGVESLVGEIWPLADNPVFDYIQDTKEILAIGDIYDRESPFRQEIDAIMPLLERWRIHSWMLVPLIYQGRLVGVIELHHCQTPTYDWTEDDKALVDAIATQLSVAIIQAESYAHLQELNHQLEALDRTRSNLIAITGHELRTPLSTIQVCLESLATEPDMPPELQQTMLQSALDDAERMRKLVQDFLTLSRLESGRVEWNLESISIQECIELALSSIHAHRENFPCPKIKLRIPAQVPLVRADGEWLVEVLVKLLDNACKFTGTDGTITMQVTRHSPTHLQVTVADTGRGIEPNRLNAVFDRFYQEEGALRRTTGGTGLGLAMCRQIIEGLGGSIWAESEGKDQGSQLHFTLPIVQGKVGTRQGQSADTRNSRRPATVPGNPSVLLDD
jgi:DICT domain-containing protein/signal transduction histidine kinase